MSLRRSDGGFSLLEVMVAIGLLALGLVIVARIVTHNVRAAHHSRMMTAATFLARVRIAAVEQSLLDYGFGEVEGSDRGDFTEQGFPSFRWTSKVERIDLPADAAKKVEDVSQKKVSQSSNPMDILTGYMGSFMGMLMEPIRLGLQESVRRLTVEVKWDEAGKPEQSFDVVTFMTDPARLESAVLMGPSSTGTNTSTSTSTGTRTGTATNNSTGTKK